MFRPIRLLRYGMAVGSVALALVLTLLLQSLLDPSVLLLFVLAVVFSSWYGGRGAGFAATILSVLASRYFLLSPVHSFFPVPGATIAALIVFSLITLLISLLETDLRLIHRRNRRHLLDLEQTEAAFARAMLGFMQRQKGVLMPIPDHLRRDWLLGITSDITEFRRVEQALRESELRFRRVMESNMIGMGFWTLAGEITEANDALLNLLGYTREAFLAEKPHWRDLTPPEYAEMDEQAVEQIRQTGVCIPFEKEYLRKDGSRVSVLCGGATFANTAESGVFFLLDLSDRKQIEKERDRLLQLERAARAEAEAANRVKDEFLMVLSHELRTPMNLILGWTKLLRTRQFAPSMVDYALEAIERNAHQQSQLVEDLLDVSCILQGKLTLDCCLVNLIDIIQGAIASVRLSAQAKSITIETHLDATVPPVLGNQERLQQIVWNLLSNAVKFTPNQGWVSVNLETIGKFAQIRVSDTGKGIEASFIPYVFDCFRQADSTTTRAFGGLGLGLAISRHLVELHGGTIEAASEGLGKGAVFTVWLPIPPEEPRFALDRSSSSVSAGVLSQKRIVLLRDEDDPQELIAVVLEQAGAVVVPVTTAKMVLEELARGQPDLLIGAIALLRENDYELPHQFRLCTQELGKAIPVVALATDPDEIDAQEAFANGLQQVLPGSIEPDELIATIVQFVLPES